MVGKREAEGVKGKATGLENTKTRNYYPRPFGTLGPQIIESFACRLQTLPPADTENPIHIVSHTQTILKAERPQAAPLFPWRYPYQTAR